MSNYDVVNGVWSDLEKSYQKLGKGKSKLGFVKDLLLYEQGESAFRELLKRIADDHAGVDDNSVSQLIEKLQTARKNVSVCEENGIVVTDLSKFVTEQITFERSAYDYCVSVGANLVGIADLVKLGSVFPITNFEDGKLNIMRVREYVDVCDSVNSVFQLVSILNEQKTEKGMAMMAAISSLIKGNKMKLPLAITTPDGIETMLDCNVNMKLVQDPCTVGNTRACCYVVQDKLGYGTVMEVADCVR